MFELIILLISLIVNSIICVTVLAKNSKSATNRAFAILVFSLFFWTTTTYLSINSTFAPLFMTRFVMFWVVIENTSFYFLTKVFPTKKFVFNVRSILELGFTGIVLLTTLSPFLFTGLSKGNNGSVSPMVGPGMVLFLAHVAWFVVGGIVSVLRRYLKSSGLEKAQSRSLILGALILYGLIPLSNFVLPLVFHVSIQLILSPIYTTLFAFVIGYSIITQKLFDIRMVVARSVAYIILLGTLAALYAGTVLGLERLLLSSEIKSFTLAQAGIQTTIAVIMVFLFQPLRRWITKITDKVFFKNAYDPEQFLDTMSHTLGGSIVLIELLYKTLNLVTSEMKITRGQVIVLSDSGKIYTSQSMGYQTAPKLDEEDVQKMVQDGVLVYDELEDNSRAKHLLRKYNASLAVPLKTEADTEGVLILGEKLSGDMYSAGDLRVFGIIAPELAVAINNAKSFEKIEKFNVTLREEVKKATAELEKKNTQLMELDKAKDEFISMASHQLRTPLTAIKGYLSMLLEGDAGEIRVSQYDFVNEAFNGANRMVGLINDLLNVSRMETGRFFLEPVEVDLEKLIGEEVKQLENHAKEKHLYLKFEPKAKTPHIWADETKIRQVVMNFIDNAVYYTNEGGVTVKLSHDAHDVIFEVSDTGIGVPKAAQKSLFTKFYRADNARHVRPDGTGLGIYLAKRVLDDHKAQLVFKSKEGEGSTFGFRFPIKSKLSTKRVTAPAPEPNAASCPPAVGELAAGIGVNPQALAATSNAGIEKPLSDSADAGELSKEAVKLSKAATGGSTGSSMPAELVKSAEEAIETMRQAEVKKEETATK